MDAEDNATEDDLAFAKACARGEADALARFDREYAPQLRPALAHIGLDDPGIDETLQLVRNELLAPREGGEPRIVNY